VSPDVDSTSKTPSPTSRTENIKGIYDPQETGTTISFKTSLNRSGELQQKNVEYDNMVKLPWYVTPLVRILFEILLSTKILIT